MLEKISLDIIKFLTISELDVLRYIDNNKRTVIEMSIQKLSKVSFTSTATIMRLCKKLEISGFSELKYRLKEELESSSKKKKSASFKEILDYNVDLIYKTSNLIEENKVNEVIDLLMKPTRIHFFGKGLTASVLEYASKQLLTYNRSNFLYQDTHIAYLAAESMNENDVLFACSLSGKTHQIIRMTQIAKSRKAKVITISRNRENELSELGDYVFSVYAEDNEDSIFDVSSRLPIMFVLNVIITGYIERLSQSKINEKHSI